MAAGIVWGKTNTLDVESDFSPFWDERMLSIPCQEGTEPVRLVHDVYASNFQQSEALSQIHLKALNEKTGSEILVLETAKKLSSSLISLVTTSLLILKCILYGHHSARILKTCLCLCGEEFIQPQKAQWVYSVRYRKMSSLQTPVFLEVDFSAEVKWVNIRQLIIETCMLHSQSRMTEQVMDDLKQDFSYWTCFGQGAVFLSVLQALMPVRCYIDSQWIGVMDVKGDINQAVVKDLTPPLVNGDKCHPESSPLWDRNPTERSPENMPDTSYSIRRPIKR
ncbi:uncharacterized protein [Taeniopygia guttata]|uniref:uncharacterized protein isoform X5 n=1 Tax=Taeniopygia guttata TaxID=59729 RepID=UPI003BB9875B